MGYACSPARRGVVHLTENMTSALLNPQALPDEALPEQEASPSSLASIETLHELYGQRIFRFLLASSRDRDAAETLTQETFLRAWSARDQFRGDCSAATWLTRIALNLLRDHTRTNRFRFWRNVANTAVQADDLASHLPHPASSAESSFIAREQLAQVWDTVATLSERQRAVFLLRFVEELELADIAQITGLPISTVKTHLYRSLAAIRSRHADTSRTKKESR
jgi:RNA polymerase sigma-70 factor (ECF subfamily)